MSDTKGKARLGVAVATRARPVFLCESNGESMSQQGQSPYSYNGEDKSKAPRIRCNDMDVIAAIVKDVVSAGWPYTAPQGGA